MKGSNLCWGKINFSYTKESADIHCRFLIIYNYSWQHYLKYYCAAYKFISFTLYLSDLLIHKNLQSEIQMCMNFNLKYVQTFVYTVCNLKVYFQYIMYCNRILGHYHSFTTLSKIKATIYIDRQYCFLRFSIFHCSVLFTDYWKHQKV